MLTTTTTTRMRREKVPRKVAAEEVFAAAGRLEAAGRPMTVANLAAESGMREGTVNRVVRELSEAGTWRWQLIRALAGCGRPSRARDETLAAAAAIVGRGGRLTWRTLADELGCRADQVGSRVHQARRVNLWPYRFAGPPRGGARQNPAPRPKAGGPRPLAPAERHLLEVAGRLADEDGFLRAEDLVRGTGLPHTSVLSVVRSLIQRGLWPHDLLHGRAPEAADAAVIAAIRDADRAPMGDGRGEVDDPVLHPGRAPRNRLATWHPPLACPAELRPDPTPTAAQACLAMLEEWRGRTSPARRAPLETRPHHHHQEHAR